MPFYKRSVFPGQAQIWEIEERSAARCDLREPGPTLHAASGEDIFDLVRKQTISPHARDLAALETEPNFYFERIARPHPSGPTTLYPGYNDVQDLISASKSQLTVLLGLLERICQTVHPVEANLDVFGHDLRNLLILASTEFEAQCKGILKANQCQARTTADYVKLLAPMRLNEYSISFARYGWLPSISPFEGWNALKPTKSLPWYDAYNATKHDRELSFSRATLRHGLSAMAAIVAVLVAQFGWRVMGLGHQALGEEREWAFRIAKYPSWPDGETYNTIPTRTGWTASAFPFSNHATKA